VAIYRFTITYSVLVSVMGCARRHIWSFEGCFERMYDLNVTIQHYGSLRVISSNTYTLYSGGLSEIRCEYDCQHLHTL